MSIFKRANARILALAVASFFAAQTPSIAQTETQTIGTAEAGDLVITGAWTRQTPPRAKVGGGYLTITNNGTGPDRLIGGKADFAGTVEIHEMAVTDGVMRMAALADGLEIPPGKTVELKPGGFHIMFMQLSASPEQGKTVPVTLTFAKAGDVTVQMPVAAIGAKSPEGEGGKVMDHGDMKMDEPSQ